MIPYERHEAIMNLLREKKYVRTEQLSKALYVSVATIRRDLTEMEKNGFLQRVSGGARVIEEPKDRPVEYMVEENVRKKKHIARLASRYLRDDQRISLDAGSTVLQLCPYFERYNNLNVLTNGLYTALELMKIDSVNVHLLGGNLNKILLDTKGTDTMSQIGMHHSDIAFISCRGITARGSFDPNDDETAVKRAFAENSTKVVLFADSRKFNKTFLNVSLGYDVIDAIISDAPFPEDIQEVCRNKNVEMLW